MMRSFTRSFAATAALVALFAAPLAPAKTIEGRPGTSGDGRFANAAERMSQVVRRIEASNAVSWIGKERWSALLASYRDGIEGAKTHAQFAALVNRLIRTGGVSHFRYFTDEDWGYWHLRASLGPDRRTAVIEHIGIVPERIGERWFVRGILEGSVAEPLDIRVGDELLTVNGERFRPIESFRGRAGESLMLELQRKAGRTHSVQVAPVRESLHAALQRAMRESISLVPYDGQVMAYMHGWTLLGPGREYGDLLALQDYVDGLLLDYRDGYGGTWHVARRFLLGGRNGGGQWNKPVVILTADGTRSAKEIVVDAAKKAKRAPLVGEPTPGAVTAVGGVAAIGQDGLLLLPGFRFELEGRPTLPDVPVERDIRYCAGTDVQLDAARDVLAGLIRAERRGSPSEPPGVGEPSAASPERRAP